MGSMSVFSTNDGFDVFSFHGRWVRCLVPSTNDADVFHLQIDDHMFCTATVGTGHPVTSFVNVSPTLLCCVLCCFEFIHSANLARANLSSASFFVFLSLWSLQGALLLFSLFILFEGVAGCVLAAFYISTIVWLMVP